MNRWPLDCCFGRFDIIDDSGLVVETVWCTYSGVESVGRKITVGRTTPAPIDVEIRYWTFYLISVAHKSMTYWDILTTIDHWSSGIDLVNNYGIPYSTVGFRTLFIGYPWVISEKWYKGGRTTYFKGTRTIHSEICFYWYSTMSHQCSHSISFGCRISWTIVIHSHITPIILGIEISTVKWAITHWGVIIIFHNGSHGSTNATYKAAVRYLTVEWSFLTPFRSFDRLCQWSLHTYTLAKLGDIISNRFYSIVKHHCSDIRYFIWHIWRLIGVSNNRDCLVISRYDDKSLSILGIKYIINRCSVTFLWGIHQFKSTGRA